MTGPGIQPFDRPLRTITIVCTKAAVGGWVANINVNSIGKLEAEGPTYTAALKNAAKLIREKERAGVKV